MSSFRQLLKVRKMVGGHLDGGRWVEGAESILTIKTTVQPATPKDLLALPEGRRTRATFVLFTKTKMDTAEVENPYRIKLFGDEYEVVGVEPWQNGVRPHFRILVQKTQATAEAVDA